MFNTSADFLKGFVSRLTQCVPVSVRTVLALSGLVITSVVVLGRTVAWVTFVHQLPEERTESDSACLYFTHNAYRTEGQTIQNLSPHATTFRLTVGDKVSHLLANRSQAVRSTSFLFANDSLLRHIRRCEVQS